MGMDGTNSAVGQGAGEPPESDHSEFDHRGARALVLLHETHLREFLCVWREFVAQATVALPETSDADYASPQALLRHVLGAARGYMVWICQKLQLPPPEIAPVPGPDEIEAVAEDYLSQIVAGWRAPLAHLSHEQCDRSTFDSSWGVPYCIDAMLEHAVMHPIRHSFQLRELLQQRR